MDQELYVFVKWNEKENRVDVHPSSVELTDAVDRVCWIADESPKSDLAVRFQGPEERGPFEQLVADPGTVRGFGNRGPDPRTYPYEVVLQSPDGPRSGHGHVINRATKSKPAKRERDLTETPVGPTGPPDVKGPQGGGGES